MLETRARDVCDARTFIAYARQHLGLPAPQGKDFAVVGRLAKEIFDKNPGTDWRTLVCVVDWCKGQRRRFPSAGAVVQQFRYAYAARAIDLPEQDSPVDIAIRDALLIENDPNWRMRLMRAQGQTARAEVLEEWRGMALV